MARLRPWTVLCALVVLCLASVARAQKPSAADRETARALMDRGYERLAEGDAIGALEDFRGADAIMAVTSTGVAVAKALEKLGKLIEARDKALSVARSQPRANETDALRAARHEATALQAALAERIPSLKLEFFGLRDGVSANVTIDGEQVPPATLTLPRKLNPATHSIRATASGYRPIEQHVSLAEREHKSATLRFQAASAWAPNSATAPNHGRISPMLWAGVGVVGAGLVVGAVTGGLSLAAAGEAKEFCQADGSQCTAEAADPRQRSLTLAHVSTASFVVAGLGAGLAVFGLYDSGVFSTNAARKPAFEPLLGPSFAGVRGRF